MSVVDRVLIPIKAPHSTKGAGAGVLYLCGNQAVVTPLLSTVLRAVAIILYTVDIGVTWVWLTILLCHLHGHGRILAVE